MLNLHLRPPESTYSACVERLINIAKGLKKFKETVYLKYIFKNELDKVCFSYNTAYSDSRSI